MQRENNAQRVGATDAVALEMETNRTGGEPEGSGQPSGDGKPPITKKKKERIKLSDHFTYGRLIRFTLPSVGMTIFTSVYSIVDGFFVSNYAGSTALAAVNLIFPPLMILSAAGFMLGSGGSALVGKVLGEKDPERARSYFSLLTYTAIVFGLFMSLVAFLLTPTFARMQGASGELLDNCVLYGRILAVGVMPYMMQYHFQLFFITSEKPRLALFYTIAAGCTNIVLDFLLIGVFRWGLAGAAIATVISQCIGGLVPLIYFARPNDSLLRLTKTHWNGWVVRRSAFNGVAEFLASAASSLVSLVYNTELMKLIGEDGVAAYGVIMYFSMVFTSLFFGYCIGVGPIISYHYGAGNKPELKNMLRKSFVIEMTVCIISAAFGVIFAEPCSALFVGYDADLLALTTHAMRLYSVCYVFMGFGYFSQVFFTSLNNGKVAGIISLIRIFILQVGVIFTMAELFGIEALWNAMTVAQFLGWITAISFIWANRKKYGYL